MTTSDSSPSTAKCVCGHTKASHLPFSAAGDSAFYGCIECSTLGLSPAAPRCHFFLNSRIPPEEQQ